MLDVSLRFLKLKPFKPRYNWKMEILNEIDSEAQKAISCT